MFPADSILSASVTRAQPSNWIITAMSLTSPKLWVVATPLKPTLVIFLPVRRKCWKARIWSLRKIPAGQ